MQIVRKENLRDDPAVQTHEDALCLVFVETQLSDLVAQLGVDKAVDVVRKTSAKMSERGLAAAADLPLSDADREILTLALT